MKIYEILTERSSRPVKGWTADASAGHSPYYDIDGDGPNKVDPKYKKKSSSYSMTTRTQFDGGGERIGTKDPQPKNPFVDKKDPTYVDLPSISARITKTASKPKGTEWKDRKTSTKFTGKL